MKRVSILIPAYNEEESLPLLYRRLADLMDAQPMYAWEVLFVNDGSRDHTLAILAQLRESDPRINYLAIMAKRLPCWPVLTMSPATAW